MERGFKTFFSARSKKTLTLLSLLLMASLLPAAGEKISGQASGLDKARWLREQGRYEESRQILEKELNQKNSQEKVAYKAKCWLNLALDYWNLGEVAKAENAFIFTLTLAGETGDEATKEYAQTALKIIKLYKEAKIKRENEDYAKSDKLFTAAIKLAEARGMDDLTLKCLRQWSFVYWHQGKLDYFLGINQKALRIAESLNNHYEILRSLNDIAIYYLYNKDIFKSYDYLDQALIVAERENLLEKEPVVLLNLATSSYRLGLYEMSAYYMERALELYQKGDDLATIISLSYGLALSLYKNGENKNNYLEKDRPKQLLTTALKLSRQAEFKDLEARVLNNLGYVLLEEDPVRAEDFCRQAWKLGLELKDEEVIVSSLNNLATISLKKNQVNQAKELFQQALEAALRADYWPEIWRNYSGLAKCYEKRGDYERAFRTYEKALEALSKIRENITFDLYRLNFDRGKREVYEGLIRSSVCLRKNRSSRELDELIFSTANRIKARVFQEEMNRYEMGIKPTNYPQELIELDRTINDFLSRPDNLRDELSSNRFMELEYRYLRLLGNGTEGKANGDRARRTELEVIQKGFLNQKQLILDYHLGPEESYCFLTSQSDFKIVKLAGEKEIERSIKLYLKLLSEPEVAEQDLNLAGSRIARLLLPVSEMDLEGTEALIIIPDGLLNYLPFETLILTLVPDGKQSYLIENFRIYYSPSIAALSHPQTSQPLIRSEKEFLGFGNPYSGSRVNQQLKARLYFMEGPLARADLNLKALPYSQQEVQQVARLFPQNRYDLFLKKKATEDNLKKIDLTKYRILHFACHGLISEEFPQRSSLILAADKSSQEDGFLTVREIYSLPLKAELVVLSACQSSRGSIEKTEGIVGLPRVFLLAGSQAVISSLWSVSDRASQELMVEFYKNLLSGQSKDEALRRAKLKMITSSKSHPYYWAGFILMGNARPIY
ncbi:MAG: CHAT domain-containing tetratricopeptide repeat protein [Candidatus Saccharicenans sp.]|nr:CHAT domain-containing tetratricopeptide repeat protein [Candidatus Saccharicenans sp.]